MIKTFQTVVALTRTVQSLSAPLFINRLAFPFAGITNSISVKTIPLPFLADSINEGTIAEFLKSNNKHISRGRTMGRTR